MALDVDGALTYFIHGISVDSDKLEGVLNKKELLPNILKKFQNIKICNGLDDLDIHLVLASEGNQYSIQRCRSKGCSLLSMKKRYDSCLKSRKCIQQRAIRLKKPSIIKQVRGALNTIAQQKLLAMRMKAKREGRQKIRAQNRVKCLKACMQAQKVQIASIQDATLDEKCPRCAKLNVPESQKLALKEIIAMANKKNAKGCCYTENWLMLCMLMNIRSPSYYEFLRRNNILPCMRMIRSYFSLINTKCGFDGNFAKFLAKHFASKAPLQRLWSIDSR